MHLRALFIINFNTNNSYPSLPKSNYIHNTTIFEKPSPISLIIREKLKSNAFSDRYIAEINTIDKREDYFEHTKDSLHRKFEIGTPLLIKSVLSKNRPLTIPISLITANI
jgi:competence protein ComEC